MKASVVLALFGLTLSVLAAGHWARRRWPRVAAGISQVTSPFLGGILPGIAATTVALSFVAMLMPYRWCYAVSAEDHYLRYRALLCELPLPIQSIIGLVLIVSMGVLTVQLFATEVARKWWLTAAILVLAWCGVYSLLPFHMSAPDFDDFFIIDKFLCSLGYDWSNDKPFFTVFDYLFRVTDLAAPGSAGPFFRFSVNGWVYVLFQLNLVVMLWRTLGRRATHALGHLGAAVALGFALVYLGPVVLAHGANYELSGTTLFLLSFNVLETLRMAQAPDDRHAGAMLGWCSVGLLIQSQSHNQMNAMWVAVLIHGALALVSVGRLRKHLSLWCLLLCCSVLLFLLRNRNAIGNVIRLSADTANASFFAVLGVIVGSSVLALGWSRHTGRVKPWGRKTEAGDTALLVCGLYAGAGALLFVVPNQMVPGIPFPLFPTHWNMGTNHARYSAMLYPFVCLVFGMLVLSIKTTRSCRLIAFAAMAFLWNQCYIAGFYSFNPDRDYTEGTSSPFQRNTKLARHYGSSLCSKVDTGSSFQRNMRPYVALEEELDRAPDGPFYFLPIPRDHGDHYLMCAVRPQSSITNLCGADPLPTSGRVLLSRHTLAVLESEASGEHAASLLPFASPCDYRSLDDTSWEVQLLPVSTINRAKLDDWCRHLKSQGLNFARTEDATATRKSEGAFRSARSEDSVEWIIPAGREVAISDVFSTNDMKLPFVIRNIRADRDRLIVAVEDRNTGGGGEVVARFGVDENSQNGCISINGLALRGGQTEPGPSGAADSYTRWLQAKNPTATDWQRIWVQDIQLPHFQGRSTTRNWPAYRHDQFHPTPNPFIHYCIVWTLASALVYSLKTVDAARSAAMLRLSGMTAVSAWAFLVAGVMIRIVFFVAL
jgi:hypothetical protein